MSNTQDSSSNERIEVEDFRQALEAVIAKKGRYYSNLATFSLQFDADNTQSSRDSKKFTDFVKSIEISTKDNLNDRLCIEPDDNVPGRTLTYKLFTLSENIRQCTRRTFLFFHYAGYGILNHYDKLKFCLDSPGQRAIRYHQTVHMTLVEPIQYVSNFLLKTDVVILLDCCFSRSAIRGSKSSDRIVEVISAVGPTQKALGNRPT